MMIRIIDVPPGEAPDEVRAAWVGLTLPVASPGRLVRVPCFGVRTGPRGVWRQVLQVLLGGIEYASGYSVVARTAVDILRQSAPQAAMWWEQNTPYLLQRNRKFLFHADACAVVDEPVE